MTDNENDAGKGIIGKVEVDGFPVIYKLVDEAPPNATRVAFTWLAVIGWEYDGSNNNGMPSETVLRRMTQLEHELDALMDAGHSVHAYSRTGNGLRELVYYIRDRDAFSQALNDALRDQPRYPISIDFYKDEAWEDFGKVRELFQQAPQTES